MPNGIQLRYIFIFMNNNPEGQCQIYRFDDINQFEDIKSK